jgi:hypothetical protein
MSEGEDIAPTMVGGKPLEFVPIVVAGSRDLSLDPDEIPLAGVARAALAIYRLDADYRHQLFMSGQDTLIYIGLNKEDVPLYVGAGVAVALPPGGDAKYVGTGGAGLDAHQKAIADERDVAAAAGARVFDVSARGAESGEALRIRARASTATLVSVALNSAAALEQALRNCAIMVGEDPEKIVVVPNLDFVDAKMTPQEAQQMVEVWMSGAISYQTLYDNLQKGEIASQERTAEEEQELAAQEQAATMQEQAAAMGLGPEAAAGAPAEKELTDEQIDAGEGVTPEEMTGFFDPSLMKKQ